MQRPGVRLLVNQELVIAALQAAYDDFKYVVHRDDYGYGLTKLLYAPEQKPVYVNLLACLRAEPELGIFDGQMQAFGNTAARWEIPQLAHWLLRRSEERGVTGAVDDLQTYLNSVELPCAVIFALAGLKLETACDLGKGIRVVGWKDLADSERAQTLFTQSISSLGLRIPSAAIVREVTLPKLHSAEPPLSQAVLDDADIWDAVLCIGLPGPSSPEVLATWLEPPPWAPAIGSGFNIPHQEGRPRPSQWTEEHSKAASRLFNIFVGLDSTTKDSLRLTMRRLSAAMRRSQSVDSAVDLGIALESLFLRDQSGDRELRFRLCLRAARYTAQDKNKRAAIFRLAGDLYDLRSKAVHTGSVPTHMRGRPIREILQDGYRLVAETTARVIDEGFPDWESVQLN
jgi:hypothetical protein